MMKKFSFTLANATHAGSCKGSSKNAFTLAEVLITLGIIGVVAAMTMPTLINQTNGTQYKSAYKKSLAALSQGVALSVALDDESFANNSAENILPKRMKVYKNIAAAPYTLSALNVTTLKADEKIPEDANKFLYFQDGSMFAFKSGNSACKESSK
jgi:prepilin-type N-terminal cleavage/methylation domain-containing protein